MTNPINPSPSPQPKITYPCLWSYRIVGTAEPELRTAIRQIIRNCNNTINLPADHPYILKRANQSAAGKYLSLNLELTVQSETHRHQLFDALSNHPAIRFVL